MTPSSGCPSDRSELVSVLEDRAGEALQAHVAECERCQLEMRELRGALALILPAADAPPSARVRREAVAYARAQVRGTVRRSTPWRAPAAAVIAAALAVFFGELAGARLTSSAPQIMSPEPWTFVLAAAWSVALFLYVSPGGSTFRSEIVANALAGVLAFTVLLLAVPIPAAVEFCAGLVFGLGPLTPTETVGTYVVMVCLYAAVPVALVSRILDSDLSWAGGWCAAFAFAALAGPLLLVQAAGYPSITGQVGFGALVCGAWIGGRLGSWG